MREVAKTVQLKPMEVIWIEDIAELLGYKITDENWMKESSLIVSRALLEYKIMLINKN